jgi:hypothetical protein
MARRDDILVSFLSHELLQEKYQLETEELPKTLSEALNSNVPIIQAIALIVNNLEKIPTATDSELRNTVLQFLNTTI